MKSPADSVRQNGIKSVLRKMPRSVTSGSKKILKKNKSASNKTHKSSSKDSRNSSRNLTKNDRKIVRPRTKEKPKTPKSVRNKPKLLKNVRPNESDTNRDNSASKKTVAGKTPNAKRTAESSSSASSKIRRSS